MKQQLSDMLKEAIECLDWEIIAQIYTSITKQPIQIPKKPRHRNKFIDDGTLVKKDSEDIKKLYNKPNLNNRRQPIEYVEVACGKCGTKETVPVHIARSYGSDPDKGLPEYRCQKCIKNMKYA